LEHIETFYIGGLVGFSSRGVIRNARSDVDVTVELWGEGCNLLVGGIAGSCSDETFFDEYAPANCYATGDVSVRVEGKESPYNFVGGIVGQGCPAYCYAAGEVSASGSGENVHVLADGVAGNAAGMKNCVSLNSTDAPSALTQSWFTNADNWSGAAWSFGSDENHPWKWNSGSGRPVLWFE
jgi:hypothetical protein